jgi:hypothetical protein
MHYSTDHKRLSMEVGGVEASRLSKDNLAGVDRVRVGSIEIQITGQGFNVHGNVGASLRGARGYAFYAGA